MNDDYLAGFIDGEGCFSITKFRSGDYPRTGRFPYWRVVLVIGNSNRVILEEIRDYLCSGWITTHHLPGKPNSKTAYLLQITGKRALDPILRRLIPKLRVKRAVAQVLLEFLSGVKTKGGQAHLPARENARRERLVLQVRKLNHRGLSQPM